MSLSQAAIVQRVRFYLGDKPWETVGSTPDGSGVVTVDNAEDWAQGDIGEWWDDGDTFWVRATNAPDASLLAIRGYNGSVAVQHPTSRILKNPKYAHDEITNAISSVINFELPWPRIYRVSSTQIDPDTGSHPATLGSWYALPAETRGLVSVIQVSDQDPAKKLEYGTFHSQFPIHFQRDLPSTLCSTGVGISFENFQDLDNTVYVTYATEITDSVTAGSYDDLDAGDAVVEAISLGAVALLQSALELRKGKREAQDTDNLRAGSYFGQLYKKALASAEKEIHQQHPLLAIPRIK